MATTSWPHNQEEDEEEYVLLDLDDISGEVHILPNAPYVLSGLDTVNPVLIFDNKLKLLLSGVCSNLGAYRHLHVIKSVQVGDYEGTIGACLIFSESDAVPLGHEQTRPSEANLISGKCIVNSKQPIAKQIKPISGLHKVLKFRLFSEVDYTAAKQKTT